MSRESARKPGCKFCTFLPTPSYTSQPETAQRIVDTDCLTPGRAAQPQGSSPSCVWEKGRLCKIDSQNFKEWDRLKFLGAVSNTFFLCHKELWGRGGIAPTFLTMALGRCEWLASSPCHFSPKQTPPFNHWRLVGSQDRIGRNGKDSSRAPDRIEPRPSSL
jgi:hypothetical protein